jgi:hypothetical protein
MQEDIEFTCTPEDRKVVTHNNYHKELSSKFECRNQSADKTVDFASTQ